MSMGWGVWVPLHKNATSSEFEKKSHGISVRTECPGFDSVLITISTPHHKTHDINYISCHIQAGILICHSAAGTAEQSALPFIYYIFSIFTLLRMPSYICVHFHLFLKSLDSFWNLENPHLNSYNCFVSSHTHINTTTPAFYPTPTYLTHFTWACEKFQAGKASLSVLSLSVLYLSFLIGVGGDGVFYSCSFFSIFCFFSCWLMFGSPFFLMVFFSFFSTSFSFVHYSIWIISTFYSCAVCLYYFSFFWILNWEYHLFSVDGILLTMLWLLVRLENLLPLF